MSDAVTLSVVWQQTSSELTAEIKQYWLDEGLVSSDVADQRADQVVVVARNSAAEIVGLSSVEKFFYPSYQNNFYLYRTSVSRRAGGQWLSRSLFNESFSALNQSYQPAAGEPLGIMAMIENKYLDKKLAEAVRPLSGLIFVGYNSKGQQIRLRYFDGAVIVNQS